MQYGVGRHNFFERRCRNIALGLNDIEPMQIAVTGGFEPP